MKMTEKVMAYIFFNLMAMSDIATNSNKQKSPAYTKKPRGFKILVMIYMSNPKEANRLK
jgi:hypothetical protein